MPLIVAFPCGRGVYPGTQGPGSGGSEPPITPVILLPVPSDPPDTPFDPPWIPPREPREPTGPGGGGGGNPGGGGGNTGAPSDIVPPGPGGGGVTGGRVRSGSPTGPTTGGPAGPTTGGPAGPAAVRGPATGGPAGPTTGGPTGPLDPVPPPMYRCREFRFICLEDIELPLAEQRIRSVHRNCVAANTVGSETGIVTSGTITNSTGFIEAYVVVMGDLKTQQECAQACTPADEVFSVTCGPQGGGGGSEPEPRQVTVEGVISESNSIQQTQNANNATTLSVNSLIEEEDYQDIQRGIIKPRLFDPTFNFFKDESNPETELVFSPITRGIFNRKVAQEVGEVISIQNTNTPWNEVTLQNLSDEKLLKSLSPKLINYFQYLRYPGGEPVGVPVLLNVIRKHVLEGTLDEFDVSYFRDVAESQYNQNFEILEKPLGSEYSDRFAINYLKSKSHTFENNKTSAWRGFQVNRMRPLNEDVNVDIQITTLNGTTKALSIPNEGIAISKITYMAPSTVPSVGRPDKLNIGNGGGYYVHGETLQSIGVPVLTKNIIDTSYYAPAPIRMKVLDMLGVDPSITLTASSLVGHHEFASGDAGSSAIKPLFFSLNLSSIDGNYVNDSLVENYSGTYSLLTVSSDIQVHMNNNALNTPMVSIDYRDPLYRYILDTSSLTLSLNDFNLNGFKDKGLSSIGSRFVRNIPFGVIITPVAGGRYNPFNGRSSLDSHGDTHVRSLSFLPATDATIDGNQSPLFQYYNLHKVDGVDRVGVAEKESTQNIGYSYDESSFTQTFYSASANEYGYSSIPASSYGVSYMLREVIDYLSTTYSTKELTWYDVFSRMPITKVGEMFYDGSHSLILDIANGLRGNVKIQNIESGYAPLARIIPEDTKTVVTVRDRRNITTSRL